MLNKTILRTTAVGIIASLLVGCATMESGGGSSGLRHTAMDTAIQRCVITVGAGALIGALASRNRASGAVTGAVAGGAVCAVLLAMANQKDKQQLAEAERQAAMTGKAQTVKYVGDDQKPRLIRVSAPVEVAPSANIPAGYGPCRASEAHISITGVGDTAAPKQVICRNPDGDYVPV